MKKRILLIGGLVALIMALGVTAVFAQEPDTADPDTGETEEVLPPSEGFPGKHGIRGMRGFHGQLEGITPQQELLADALDITVEELQEARTEAHNAWLAEMVEVGYFTQEQADLMLAAQALRQFIDRQAILAEALGIDDAELEAAREAGTTIPELIHELDLDPADVRDAGQAAYEAAVQDAVNQGVISQEQADQILSSGPGLRGPGMGFGGIAPTTPASTTYPATGTTL